MISRCSDARDRSSSRSEWGSETTTDVTTGGCPRTPLTSNGSRRTMFTVGTARRASASLAPSGRPLTRSSPVWRALTKSTGNDGSPVLKLRGTSWPGLAMPRSAAPRGAWWWCRQENVAARSELDCRVSDMPASPPTVPIGWAEIQAQPEAESGAVQISREKSPEILTTRVAPIPGERVSCMHHYWRISDGACTGFGTLFAQSGRVVRG